MKEFLIRYVMVASLVTLVSSAQAGSANDPVALIVPFSKGGATDIAGRVLVAQGPKIDGRHIKLEHRTGAGGAVGSYLVAQARTDGNTMLVARVGSHTVGPAMRTNLPYTIDDFRYVGVFELNPVVCAVSPSTGIRTMEELVHQANKAPLAITFTSSGFGTLPHIASVFVLDTFGVRDVQQNVTHVPFRGGGEAAHQVAKGNATFLCTNSSSLMPRIRRGELIPLLVTSERRLAGVEAPSVMELGKPGLAVLQGWSAIAGPKQLEEGAYRLWRGWLDRVTDTSTFQAALKARGSVPVSMSAVESVRFIKHQYSVFRELAERLELRSK